MEFLSIPILLGLAWLTPSGLSRWLMLAACAALVGMQIVYWVVTHPVNKIWLDDAKLSGAGTSFFGAGRKLESDQPWTALRDRWEYSHVARAVLGFAALGMLAYAIAR